MIANIELSFAPVMMMALPRNGAYNEVYVVVVVEISIKWRQQRDVVGKKKVKKRRRERRKDIKLDYNNIAMCN